MLADPHVQADLEDHLRHPYRWFIGAIFIIFGVIFTLFMMGWLDSFLVHLALTNPWVILGMLALSLVNYTLRTYRWQVFTASQGLTIPWLRNSLYYVAGFMMAITPGKVGEALRLWLLRRGHGYRYEKTASILVADRLSDLTAVLLLCVISTSSIVDSFWPTVSACMVVAGATLCTLKPVIMVRVIEAFYRRVRRFPRLFVRLRQTARQFAHLASVQTYALALLLALVGWFAEALALFWVLQEMGASVELVEIVFIFCFAMLAGAATMLPGGLGGTEVSMVGMLVALGVDFEIAVTATAIIRATTLWFSVLLGVPAFMVAVKLVNTETMVRDQLKPPPVSVSALK